MVEVTLSTSIVEASVPFDPELHPHQSAGSPKGGQFAPKGTKSQPKTPAKKAPAKTPAKQKPQHGNKSGGQSGTGNAPAKHHGRHHRTPPMSVGANNDPAKVKQLQALIRELGLGHGVIDGQYGPATERAVMAAQRKLGMKPTGKASNAFLKRLHDAHALSPCTPKSGSKVAAAAAGPVELDAEVDGEFVEVLASGCDLFDLARWSDDTVWLVDADDDGLLELDRSDVAVVAAGLQQLVGEVTAVDVADWLSLDSDGAVATISADADGGPVAVTFPADAVGRVAESLWTLHGRMGEVEAEPDEADDEPVAGWYVDLDDPEMRRYWDGAEVLGEPVPIAAAAGHDITPGHDFLHHWWVYGPGLPRWAESDTPWSTLLANLVKAVKGKVPIEELKRWASAWYKERFGFSSGSDLARVAHGKPPRGHNIGPG